MGAELGDNRTQTEGPSEAHCRARTPQPEDADVSSEQQVWEATTNPGSPGPGWSGGLTSVRGLSSCSHLSGTFSSEAAPSWRPTSRPARSLKVRLRLAHRAAHPSSLQIHPHPAPLTQGGVRCSFVLPST